jgi:hypothetical protein
MPLGRWLALPILEPIQSDRNHRPTFAPSLSVAHRAGKSPRPSRHGRLTR